MKNEEEVAAAELAIDLTFAPTDQLELFVRPDADLSARIATLETLVGELASRLSVAKL